MGNVTEAQVPDLLKNLDTNKSIGIPNKLIKIAALSHFLFHSRKFIINRLKLV